MNHRAWTPEKFLLRLKGTDDPKGCWEWIGIRSRFGYGKTSLGSKGMGAHRVAYALFKGMPPRGLDVCHRCDNRLCCNPNHLYLGTRRQNMQDCAEKDRSGKQQGSAHHKAKLSEQDVSEIRAIYASAPSRYGLAKPLAERFGVHTATIQRAAQGANWDHVETPVVPAGNPRQQVACEVCGTVVIATPRVPRRYCSLPCFHRRNQSHVA
jgi:hypothetical protein